MKIRFLVCMLALSGLLLGSCSNKGVRMPKHRKRTHCDCPTFSQLSPADTNSTLAWSHEALEAGERQ